MLSPFNVGNRKEPISYLPWYFFTNDIVIILYIFFV